MQAVHSAFSIGAILSPLVSQPFLAELRSLKVTYINSTSSSLSNSSLDTIANPAYIPVSGIQLFTLQLLNNNSLPNLEKESTQFSYGDTRIYIPYSISGGVCLLAGSLYFVALFKYGNVYKKSLINTDTEKSMLTTRRAYSLSTNIKAVFTIMLALTLAIYLMIEQSIIGFLMTFAITELEWSQSKGSFATAVLWIAFATGRLSGIAVVKYVSLSVVIIAFSCILTSGAVLFWVAVLLCIDVLIWVSIVIIGFGMSVILATVLTWISENVRKLTGKVTSILYVSMTIGAMVNPIVLGYLMDKISQMWMIYWLWILCGAMITLLIAVQLLFRLIKKSCTNQGS